MLDAGICVKSDLEAFPHHHMNTSYEFRIHCLNSVYWLASFRISLYLQNVSCLVWFQDPVLLESMLLMMSESCTFRKCIVWYGFRVLNSQKVYCLLWVQDPLSSESIKYKVESLTLYHSRECLRMCFYTSWWNFANVVSPAQMTIKASSTPKIRARSRSECPSPFGPIGPGFWGGDAGG